MDKELSYKLLRIAYSGLKQPEDSAAYAVGRDLYDLVESTTFDATLVTQMFSGRRAYKDRLLALQYVNHRLNIGLL